MSMRITRKEVKNTHLHTIAVPYCALQSLLRYRVPYAHTERREGWGADIYTIGTFAIATGYAPFGDVKAPYEVCKKYEDMAEHIPGLDKPYLNYAYKREYLDSLIWRFIKEVCPNDN